MINHSINRMPKKGCIITACEPEKHMITARMAPGQDIPVHAYTYAPAFRWPMVGEEWIVREENGAWFLDSILEPQNPTETS